MPGDRVIVHTRQGEREIVRAVDLETGKELWRTDTPRPVHDEPGGAGARARAEVDAGRSPAAGCSRSASAASSRPIDLATGKVLWRTDAPPAPPEFGTAMSPIVEGGSVIVHVGAQDKGALTAFDAATGKPRWRWAGDGPAYASPVIADIGGTRQVITQTRERP